MRVVLEAIFVEGARDEAAERWMHAPAPREEDAVVGVDRRLAGEEVVERRAPALAGVAALRRLGELHLIAEEDEASKRVTERELSEVRAQLRERLAP